jgi:hypothetical protein
MDGLRRVFVSSAVALGQSRCRHDYGQILVWRSRLPQSAQVATLTLGTDRLNRRKRSHVPCCSYVKARARTFSGRVRHDWTREEVRALFDLPFADLIFEAQRIHRLHFEPCEVQISTLLSIKTGGCPEDCAYCAQSAHYETGVKAKKLMRLDAVLTEARAAKAAGASFILGFSLLALSRHHASSAIWSLSEA